MKFLISISLSIFLCYIFKTFPTFKEIRLFIKKLKAPRKRKSKKETARQYVNRINGNVKKDNIIIKTHKDTEKALTLSNQSNKMPRVIFLSRILAILGGGYCVIVGNYILTPVITLGLYLLPQWLTRFSVYKYKRKLNIELSNTLSAITSSYIRHNDFVKAVEDNIQYMRNPVKKEFEQFLLQVKYVNSNIRENLDDLYEKFDNNIFKKWVLSVIMCQDDHNLAATLPSIVQNFSTLEEQQAENEILIYQPLMNVIQMILLAIAPVLLYGLMFKDMSHYLFHTIWGQGALAITTIVIFKALDKAIQLCEPLEMEM